MILWAIRQKSTGHFLPEIEPPVVEPEAEAA